MSFRKISKRDRPESIARRAAVHELHLRAALRIALGRAKRSNPMIQELLSQAAVEGIASHLKIKAAVVRFKVPRLRQSWSQLIPWQALSGSTPAQTATSISASLRESFRRWGTTVIEA